MKHNLRTITKTLAAWSLALTVALAGVTALAPAARAHEGMEHITGTVVTVGDNTLSIKDTKGKTVDVHVDAKTEYALRKTAAKFTDLKAGDRVVVHAMEMNGSMVAHEVNIGTAKAKKP